MLARVIHRLAQLIRDRPPPMLGRWCLPTSHVYSGSCDQAAKGRLADSDNSVWDSAPLEATPTKPRDPVIEQDERDVLVALRDRWHG